MHELAIQIKNRQRSTLFPLSSFPELEMVVVRWANGRAVVKPGSVSLHVPKLMKEVISRKWGSCWSETLMVSVSRALVSWQAGSVPNAKAVGAQGWGSNESLEVVVAGPHLLPCTT